jgi:hypothetical protein
MGMVKESCVILRQSYLFFTTEITSTTIATRTDHSSLVRNGTLLLWAREVCSWRCEFVSRLQSLTLLEVLEFFLSHLTFKLGPDRLPFHILPPLLPDIKIIEKNA